MDKLYLKTVNKVSTEAATTATVNLGKQEVLIGEEMIINYSYTDQGQQMMILDIVAPVCLAGIF